MRFDTRNKKPALYSILAAAVIAAAGMCAMELAGPNGLTASGAGAILSAFFAAALILLIAAFFMQLQYNPYSYNTIIYFGFALFILFILVTCISMTAQVVKDPSAYGMPFIIEKMAGSAKTYLVLSFPFIFVFSILLFISNVSLIRHEGRRFVNILGIILSFLLVGGVLLLYRMDTAAQREGRGSAFLVLLTNICAAVYLYFECMLIGAVAASLIVTRYEPGPDRDFLIILGCGLKKDGTPTPILAGRIERAIAFYDWQKSETGKELTFVASGGQGPDEVMSESASIKRYLVSTGIPESRIIEEDKSGDTLENMKFSKAKIDAIDPEGKVAFSTTNYHVFRSGLCARRVKMRAVGMWSGTRWYFWPNAWVREFVGLLTEHRGKQALVLGSLAGAYVVLTRLVGRVY